MFTFYSRTRGTTVRVTFVVLEIMPSSTCFASLIVNTFSLINTCLAEINTIVFFIVFTCIGTTSRLTVTFITDCVAIMTRSTREFVYSVILCLARDATTSWTIQRNRRSVITNVRLTCRVIFFEVVTSITRRTCRIVFNLSLSRDARCTSWSTRSDHTSIRVTSHVTQEVSIMTTRTVKTTRTLVLLNTGRTSQS